MISSGFPEPYRYPTPESITIHPADRTEFNRQLPTARVYGQPLPPDLPIHESVAVPIGAIRIRIDGKDITCTLGHAPEPRWLIADPITGLPLGRIT